MVGLLHKCVSAYVQEDEHAVNAVSFLCVSAVLSSNHLPN